MVTLGRREEAEGAIPASVNAPEEPATREILGLTVSTMTPELREQLGIDEEVNGLVVENVAEDSQAYEKGLRPGDVITEAGQEAVATLSDLEGRMESAKEAGRKSLLLLIRRQGDPRFVALSLDES